MSHIPDALTLFIYHAPKRLAAKIFWWLQSNSNTVVVDELLIAVRKRRDWKKEDES